MDSQPYEHRQVKATLSDALELLDLPLSLLHTFVQKWYSKNFEVVLQTTPLPRSNADPANATKHNRVLRIRDPRAKRYGWSPSSRTENSDVGPLSSGKRAGDTRPWWVDRPRPTLAVRSPNLNVSREELARREWPQSPVSSASCGPDTPDMNECWNDRAGNTGSYWDESFDPPDVVGKEDGVGHKLASQMRKGLKAMFSS
jgi:hypothetical protein